MKHKQENEQEKESNVKISIIKKGRKLSLWVEGGEKLLLCLESCVRILLKSDVLCLTGKELSCLSYATGAIEIAGHIESILFERVREDER